MNKLKSVLLIDDCKATNYIHRLIIEKYGFTESITEFMNGREAMDYLTTAVDGVFPQPDLIFLDLNMPVMNGWEFLDEYKLLPKEQHAGVVVVMLTTSLNPDDESTANTIEDVNTFSSKPLTMEKLDSVLTEYYADCVRELP
ncbi:Response regulator rcp1 [Zhongshania aliphaticivorans]|uniref:Response regulator rcp1 n=1 Tax=Zhongshania aliphaticivorans TaxID=1470434 RepID=A0A5S9NWM4_9GAMM|nr:response regulator [Zhongshania aliphaticivorans]CAA0095092.1 Response regulator rcp1 [Zhongshania aliphaticivorans]CAA0112878.1 Response regulator rcp1 [Zhongshania aliphaticivorans]